MLLLFQTMSCPPVRSKFDEAEFVCTFKLLAVCFLSLICKTNKQMEDSFIAELRVVAQPSTESPCTPYWVTRMQTTEEFVVATFQPCSCRRGSPPKPVIQEKVRFGPRGMERTVAEAMIILIEKVHHCVLDFPPELRTCTPFLSFR